MASLNGVRHRCGPSERKCGNHCSGGHRNDCWSGAKVTLWLLVHSMGHQWIRRYNLGRLVSWAWAHRRVYWIGPLISAAIAAIVYDNIFICDDGHELASHDCLN